MVASRQVEIPFHRGIGRQRERVFHALAQFIGRTANLFLRKYIVSAAKRESADLLEFFMPEYAVVVSGRKNFKTAANFVRKHTLKKQLVSGSRKKKGAIGVGQATTVFPTKSANETNRSRRDIFKNISQ